MKRLNSDTGKPFKRGDFKESTGMYFWTYQLKKTGDDGFFREHWLHRRSYENAKNAVNKARKLAQKNKNEGKIQGKKRVNPSTGQPYVMGELVEGNKYFVSNDMRHVDNDGYFRIQTATKERLHEKRIIGMCNRLKRQSFAKKLPFNLSPDYLMEIFPKDSKCPVLGIKMVWGDKTKKFNGPRMNSPSLDKFTPSLGYVMGNVNWISMRANYIKQDATPDELRRVADWLEKVNRITL